MAKAACESKVRFGSRPTGTVGVHSLSNQSIWEEYVPLDMSSSQSWFPPEQVCSETTRESSGNFHPAHVESASSSPDRQEENME